ncbi:MAG TPA: long-chain fatty acid--CoA ligase [Candidatus Thermoplasmatota archaeon]|nr:long-chain fatty acid--CoA ligase [Candidatus Thermoplasmatota archaeon]
MPSGDTLCEVFWSAVRKHGGRQAQEWFEDGAWRSRTYAEFGAAARDVAHGLLATGVKKGDRVAVWSKNCPQWAEVDFANQTAGFVTVPVYDTLTGEKGAYILNDSDAKVLFVQDAGLLERVLSVRSSLKSVKAIVLIQGRTTAEGVVSYGDFVAKGRTFGAENPKKLDQMAAKVLPDDLASFVYTSGTTGEPKGAVLTQGNFATNSCAMDLVQVGPEDVFLSFLPLSHVFERTGGHFGAYRLGAKVVFARSVDTLMDDMQTAKPTIMMSVPRLYEKMYSRMTESVAKSSFIKRAIFDWAISVGRAANVYRERGEPLPKSLASKVHRADKLVFHKVKDRVGGRLRYFVSGGAALSKDIEEFFWAAGICILQGYGLTETAPVCNVNTPTALRFGSVGRTIPGVTCKVDPAEWVAAKPRPFPEGEICYKGPNVFQGYWKNDKATKDCFDAEGWFHTGDIGYVDDDGFLFITDRKKEIIVMSNGKKVPPQSIENDLKIQPHIAQAMVVGDDRNYIAALLVPNWETLEKFCLENGIAREDRGRLVADQRVVSLFEREVEAVNAKLSRYEQIKKFWILPAEWTVESGELTPSMKLKRRIILDKQKDGMKQLYPAEETVMAR